MAKRRMIIAILLLLSAGLLSAAESSMVQVTGTINPAPLVTKDIPLISDESTGLTVVARIYTSENKIDNVTSELWSSAISLKNGDRNYVELENVNLMSDPNHRGIESFALIYGIGGNTKDSVSASVTVSSVAWTKDNENTDDIKFNISSDKFDSSTTWYAIVTDAADNSGNDVITFHGKGNQQELVPVAYTYVTWYLDGVTVLPVGEYSATVEITVDGDG